MEQPVDDEAEVEDASEKLKSEKKSKLTETI